MLVSPTESPDCQTHHLHSAEEGIDNSLSSRRNPTQLCLTVHPSLYHLHQAKCTEVDIEWVAALNDGDAAIEEVQSFIIALILIGKDEQVVLGVYCNVVRIEIIIEVPVPEYLIVQ